MNHFGLSRSRNCDKDNNALIINSFVRGEVVAPAVIEGVELLDVVCPVSSLTGNRMSIYEAIQMVGAEKYSRALDALLPEVPAIMNDSRLSDDDRVEILTSRLNTGSASEDSRLRESLAKIVQDFKQSVEKPPIESVTESNVESVANE